MCVFAEEAQRRRIPIRGTGGPCMTHAVWAVLLLGLANRFCIVAAVVVIRWLWSGRVHRFNNSGGWESARMEQHNTLGSESCRNNKFYAKLEPQCSLQWECQMWLRFGWDL